MIASKDVAAILRRWVPTMPLQCVDMLAVLARERDYQPGEIIFRHGQAADDFYVITSGVVELRTQVEGKTHVLERLEAGREFGWSVLMDVGVRQFEARAATEVHVLAFSGYSIRECCERQPEAGYALMKHLVSLIAGRLAKRMQVEATQ